MRKIYLPFLLSFLFLIIILGKFNARLILAADKCDTGCETSVDCQGALDGCTECRDTSFYAQEWTGEIYKTCQEPQARTENEATQQAESGPTKYLGPAENICLPDVVSTERDPRPAICNLCDKEAPLTPSCATSFEVFDEIGYLRKESEIIKKDWGGNVTVDPTQIKIPFVGKRNMEPEGFWEKIWPLDTPDENVKKFFQFWEISNASESKYLADYLEGTNEYYRNYGDQTTITNYQGVLRKLTPFEYQNQLKRKLVARVGNEEEDQIHNYKIKYIGRVCWDFPVWLTVVDFAIEKIGQLVIDNSINKVLTFFSNLFNTENPPRLEFNPPEFNHYCLYASMEEGAIQWIIAKGSELTIKSPIIGEIYEGLADLSEKIPGLIHVHLGKAAEGNLKDLASHLPPEAGTEEYQKRFLEWKKADDGYWYRLWQAAPMLSREDTQGEIDPYLAQGEDNTDDTFVIENEEEAKIEAVPHLARLYEGSQIINQILTPKGIETEMFASEPNAQTIPPNACFIENYFLADDSGDGLCCGEITGKLTAWEEFENPYYQGCQEALNKVNSLQAIIRTLTEEELSALTDALKTLAECNATEKKEVSRAFGVNLEHPYLDEIWSYSTYANSAGFFNVFRPYEKDQFEDINAADVVSYLYNPKWLDSNGGISPPEGYFFFPHLGGVQKAKEWIVNQALWPYEGN